MRYAWIEEHRDRFEIARMCRQLDVSRTGFYQWRGRPTSPRVRADSLLDAHVAAIHAQREPSKRACPLKISPATIPKPKTSIVCLFSSPKPATMPNASHHFGEAPFTMRTAIHAQSIQKSGSKAFIEKNVSKAR